MSSADAAILRNCLGNLYMAVARYGLRPDTPADKDVLFAMDEAARALGPPYSELETCEQCSGTKRTPDGLNCTACNAMGESAAACMAKVRQHFDERRLGPVCSACQAPNTRGALLESGKCTACEFL